MKVNVVNVIEDYQGKPVQDGELTLTVREVIVSSINAVFGPGQQSAEEKYRCYFISKKVWSGKEVDLTPKEIAIVKQKVGERFNPLVYGRICDLLDGTASDDKGKAKE